MNHVLFVDDEVKILDGLKRLLRSFRNQWTMGFVDSGEAAIAYMTEHSVDTLVTDMRMPGMDGCQLLQTTMAQWPHTVRIVLSGQSDRELLLKAAGLAHQYLSKPCDADLLKSTIQRAHALQKFSVNETLKRLVSKMTSIPSLPCNYQEIMAELREPEPSLKVVGEIMARDAAMTAKVLQLVNSAFFGLPRRITDCTQAVNLLGLHTVNGLLLSASVFSQFDQDEDQSFSLDDFVQHSLQVAELAKKIGQTQSREAVILNDCFVGGLLHDIGKLVLATNFPRQYGEALTAVRDWDYQLVEVEREMFGASHADVGAYVLSLWGLPTALVEAVAYHHEPDQCCATGFTPLTAVHVANSLAPPPGGGEPRSEVDRKYLETIGLHGRLEAWQAFQIQAVTAG
jgi:putative nucleotidyltransferase with HDIG domain